MAIRFKDTISINEEYTFPSQDGTADQILATDGAGNISFVDVAGGEAVKIECKNTSGSTITKGTPVYVTGTVGTSFRVEVAPADASNSAKMPAVGLLETDLANNGEGYVVTGGLLKNLTTDPIDGTNTTSNDTIYVKAGGGLTMTKPTGSNLIQNIGKVGRVNSANAGSIVVSSILRTNDVPNLTEGKIWVGSANNTIESTVVHIDETNERVGINKTSPAVDLDILNSTSSGIVRIVDTNSADVRLAASGNASSVGTNSTHDFNIKTDNAVRMTIDSSGLVGIGTDSPTVKLEINPPSGDADLILSSNGTQTLRLDQNSIRTTTTNDLTLFTNGNTNQLVLDSGGNIGIGTNSPSQKLDVEGSGSNIAILLNRSDAATSGSIKIEAGNNTNNIYSTGSKDLTISTNSAERLRIDSSGNVGIGTTNPAQGNLVISPTAQAADLDGLVLAYNPDGASNRVRAQLYIDNFNGVLDLKSGSDVLTTRISSAGNSYFNNGNLGVGTNSPASLMHLSSTSSTGANLILQSTHTSGIPLLDLKGAASSQIRYVDETGAIQTRIDMLDSGEIRFVNASGAVERLRIDSSGRVGIGTPSPSQKLTVEGNIELGTGGYIYGDTTNPRVYLNNASGAFLMYGSLNYIGVGSSNVSATVAIHAPAFYDINDTAYYCNPASTSKLYKVTTNTSQDRVKLGVWDSTNTYGMGMMTGFTFGPLNNDYAMTFEMNNDSDRGFWWGDDTHTNAQGAMALTTDGRLTVARSLRVGYGESDTTSLSSGMQLKGNLSLGTPGNGQNTDGRFVSIEGNTDASGEGSGRIFFSEHNSTTASMSNYGMSLGYRGGSTSVVGADGNTWTGLTAVGNGWWGMWGHDNNATGSLIMSGPRSGDYVNFSQTGGVRAQIYYDLNDTAYYLDPASTTNLNALNVDGVSINAPSKARIYTGDPHIYTGGVSYYTYFKVAQLDANGSGFLKYVCKDDQNYPHHAVGYIVVSSHSSASMSVSNQLITARASVTPEAYIDNNRNIWIRMNGAAWGTYFEWMWDGSSGLGAVYDGSTNQTSQPANSTLIGPGQAFKFNYTNTGAPSPTVDYTGDFVHETGIHESYSHAIAPTFYDSNNTGYYLDPSGASSRLNYLYIGEAAYSTSADYVGLKTEHMSGANDYMIISGKTDGNTYVSAKDGSDVYIRGGGNLSSNQIRVSDGSAITITTSNLDISGTLSVSNNTGAYIAGAAGDYGTYRCEGVLGSSGTWAGWAIRDDWVFMSNGSAVAGIYNDTNNEWSVYCEQNARTILYYNGTAQVETQNGYLLAPNQMRSPIFYDSNNTSFYANPASTSEFNQIDARYFDVEANAAYAIRFWGGSQTYSIRMSAASDSTYGGRVAGETTSDYNMYFTMNAGTNRGFVFKGANTTSGAVAGIDASGNGRFIGDVVAYSSSDERLKDNKKNIDNALEKVESLNGVEFDWNDKQDVYSGHDVGVIAQEVEKVLPEIVNTRDTGYKAVKYEKLVPLLIEAVKELSEKVKMLENK